MPIRFLGDPPHNDHRLPPSLQQYLRDIRDAVNFLARGPLAGTVTGTSYTMSATDVILLVNNTSGSTYTITPPPVPGINQVVKIKDAGGTAGTNAITFVGTVDGEVNPTLLDVNYASTSLYFSGGSVYRLDA